MLITLDAHINNKDLVDIAQVIISSHFSEITIGEWKSRVFLASNFQVENIRFKNNILDIAFCCDVQTQKENEDLFDTGTLDVQTSCTILIRDDYTIAVQLDISNLKWLKGPVLSIGFLELSLKTFTNKLLKLLNTSLQQKASLVISESISRGLQFHLNKLRNSNASIQFQNHLYASVIPQAIYFKPYLKGNQQSVYCHLKGDYLISENALTFPANWKPKIQFSDSDISKASNLSISIPNELLEQIIKQNIEGKQLKIRGREIHIVSSSYTCKDNQPEIGLEVSGDFRGSARAQLKLIFLPPSQELKVKITSLNLKPKNIFYRVIAGWVEKRIIQEMERNSIFRLDHILQNRLNEGLQNFIESKATDFGVNTSTEITQLKINALSINDQGLNTSIYTEIDLSAQLKSKERLLALYKDWMQ